VERAAVVTFVALLVALALGTSAFAFTKPDWDSAAYRGENLFYIGNLAPKQFYPNNVSLRLGDAKGNCTWYAHGRARELGYQGTALDRLSGNAGTWSAAANGLFDVDKAPRVGDIAEKSGHVAFVEEVDAARKMITISESGYYYPAGSMSGDFLYSTRSVPFSAFSSYIHVFTAGPPTPPKPVPPARKVGPATAMVIDVSGSMDESFQGQRKIDKAKEAAKTLVAYVKDRSAVTRADGELSVTVFSNDARRPQDMTLDYPKVVAAIDKLQSGGGTDLSAGMEDGLTALEQAKTTFPKTMIVLSDGKANRGIKDPDEVIAGPVARATKLHVKIYTIGFGESGNLNEALLRRMATTTGGLYSLADAGKFKTDLDNLFIDAQVSSTANIVVRDSGTVAQGKTASVPAFTVPPGSGDLQAVLNWPGSKLRLTLIDPSGIRVRAGYPGYRTSGTRPIQVAVKNAKPGKWKASVYGEQVSQAKEPYYFIGAVDTAPAPSPAPTTTPTTATTPTAKATASATPSAKPSKRPAAGKTVKPSPAGSIAAVASGGGGGGGTGGGGVLLFIVLIVGGGLIAWLVVRERAAATAGTRSDALVLVAGDGHEHPLHAGTNSVGRDYGNDVLLDDPSVSRRHAVLEVAPGGVDLRDAGSTYGTLVNGLRVSARRVVVGDEVAFGAERLWLREARDGGLR